MAKAIEVKQSNNIEKTDSNENLGAFIGTKKWPFSASLRHKAEN